MECYLDNGATTRPFDEVIDMMVKTMKEDYANPSSLHRKGFLAEQYISEAREIIAGSLKASKTEILFTSGGTEANNQAIFSAVETRKRYGNHIVTTSIEHPSVYQSTEKLRKDGIFVDYLPVNELGKIDEEIFKNTVREDTILLSMMLVNNEIGSMNEIERFSKLARKINPDILIHVDAIQGYGKLPINTKRLDVNFISVSGHKIHGPKGVGFLYVKAGTRLLPYIFGGGQQKNLRSGTENVPAVAGLGAAVKLIFENFDEKINHLYHLKKMMAEGILREFSDAKINGLRGDIALSEAVRETAPHILSVSFKNVKAEVLLHALEEREIYVSSGSACSSNHPSLSGTLKGIGVEKELLDCTIRFSFSLFTTEVMIEKTLAALKELVPILSKYRRR